MTKASLGKAWASSPASLPGSPLQAFASPFPSNVLYCLSPRCVCLTYSSISPACLRAPQTMSTQCSVPRPSSELKHPPYLPLPHCSSHRPMVIRKRLDCSVNHNVKVGTDDASATKAALEQRLKVNKNRWNQTPLRSDSKGGFINTALPSYTQIRSEWLRDAGEISETTWQSQGQMRHTQEPRALLGNDTAREARDRGCRADLRPEKRSNVSSPLSPIPAISTRKETPGEFWSSYSSGADRKENNKKYPSYTRDVTNYYWVGTWWQCRLLLVWCSFHLQGTWSSFILDQ